MRNRWVLLEHRISRFELSGLHYDLLLENFSSCRTWRLAEIPVIDGEGVEVMLLASHKLDWLEREEAYVSGDRGWAKRIEGGIFFGDIPYSAQDPHCIFLEGKSISAQLEVEKNICRLTSLKKK